MEVRMLGWRELLSRNGLMSRLGLMVCVSLFTVSCSETTAPGEKLDLKMLEANGSVLPLSLGRVPGRLESDPCSVLLSEGSLELDVSANRFQLVYVLRDSCSNSILSIDVTRGTYIREGGTLQFTLDGTPPTTFIGQVNNSRTLMTYFEYTFGFEPIR